MIIKGGSRAGPAQLAKHLQRRDTNERVEILELQSAAPNIEEALRDWQTLSEGTRGTKGLYHVNIDPATDYTMTPAQWQRAVEVLESELGFDGQPRLVLMHEKHGRQHIHVVWSRTDLETMTLKSDSMNYPAHERASLRLELEFGHEMVPGKHAKRDRKKQPEFPRAEMTQAEWQQGERTGINPAERKDQITALKQSADNAQAFKAALDEHGYILAKGDQRKFVIVDQHGEIYSLSRQIRGMKPAEFREFMKGIDIDKLPTAAQAVGMQEHLRQPEREKQKQKQAQEQTEKTEQQPKEPPKGLSPAEIQALEKAVAERQAREAAVMRERHETEFRRTRDVLDREIGEKLTHRAAMQAAERARFERVNAPSEFAIDRVLGAVQRWWNPKQAGERQAELRRQRQDMEDRQKKEYEEYAALLKQTRDLDLENLAERHAQQSRDHVQRTEKDLARHIREEETARRLLAEIEERERRLEEERSRDGPEWPPPLTR